ncbi:MAG: hypothetical protein QOI09_1840 [Chloroflexota bacterium]|nr:hypothetical protein [Chloroflexota bacterium]
MTASDFAFLALGLVLGVAVGAALIEIVRARPSASREIRVTVAPNSIHARRSTTLADDAFAPVSPGPAAGGPADRRWNAADTEMTHIAAPGRRTDERRADEAPHGDQAPAIRTPVLGQLDRTPAAGSPPTSRAATPTFPVPAWLARSSADGASAGGASASLVAVPMSLEPDPITQALRATAQKVGVAVTGAGPTGRAEPADRGEDRTGDAPGQSNTAPKARPRPKAPTARASSPDAAEPSTGSGTGTAAGGRAASDDGPCAEERRVADERCAVAGRAREGAAGAAEALRAAHRAYDGHVGSAEAAAAAIDPRSVRTAKESAQHRFRDARSRATTRDDVEAAARTWLSEINDINRDTREAGQRIERDRASAAALAPVLERLAVEADAARISAERADEACIAARETVAACDEARTLAAAVKAAPRRARDGDRIAAPMPAPEDEIEPAAPMGSRAGGDAVLLRILRGDREAMVGAVAHLGGDDPEARRRWQGWLSGLADALIARSIEASAFDFPLEHPFWGPFNQGQSREIAAGLSSMGYRFDGFGGWVDDRIPAQRDLSLAVGYAGLDPMRIRRWPTETEMRELFVDVRVAADQYVADTAGGLTLGELVTLLGRRADALTELWNEWGTVRPILLAAI